MKNWMRISLVIVLVVITGIIALPQSVKQSLPDGEPPLAEQNILLQPSSWAWKFKNSVAEHNIKYGIDLAGGARLDFLVDLDTYEKRIEEEKKAAEEAGKTWDGDIQISQAIRGIKETLRRRVDPDGSKELNIYSEDHGDEHHIFVELTADIDNPETREKLKQYIDLVFKEPKPEADDAEKEATKIAAEKALSQISDETDFEVFAEENKGKPADLFSVRGEKEVKKFEDQLTPEEKEKIWNAEAGIIPELISGSIYTIAGQQLAQVDTYGIYRIYGKETVTRTKTESGEDFDAVALEVSEKGIIEQEIVEESPETTLEGEEPEATISAPEEEPETPKTETVVEETPIDYLPKELENTLMEEVQYGKISDIKEVEGGYAIFQLLAPSEENGITRVKQIFSTEQEKVEAALERVQEKEFEVEEEEITFDRITYQVQPSMWQETGLDGRHFKTAKVAYDEFQVPFVAIEFNEEGGELFRKLTKKLSEEEPAQPMAIFVGGNFISSPIPEGEIAGGSARITINAENYYETKKQVISLVNDLNAGAIAAPVELVGERKIDPTLGKEALNLSVLAGLIGLTLLAFYMVFSYRLLGVFALLSLGVYAVLILFFMNLSSVSFLFLTIIATLGMVSFLLSVSQIEKDSLVLALLGISFWVVLIFISSTQIVLTLAGIAGIVLSIGMAVDANILIFERMREELQKGRSFSAALTVGFERAWASIRDANATTLLVCLILYWVGTDVVQKFAMMLGIGVILSMFTSITITKTFLKLLVGTKLSRNKNLLVKVK